MITSKKWLNSKGLHLFKILILVLFLASCKEKTEETSRSKALPVEVKKVEKVILRETINSSGILKSKNESKLSFKTGGIIKKIHVNEGEAVNKNQKLASLNLSEINELLTQAELSLKKAKRDFKRAQNLYNDSVATLESYQNAKTALNYAKSSYEIALFNKNHSIIKAPEKGIILKKFKSENEITASGHPVFLFASGNENWIVKTNLSDKDIVKVKKGDSADISFDAYPQKTFKGTVSEVGEFADPYTGTYKTELKLVPVSIKLVNGLISKNKIYLKSSRILFKISVKSLTDANDDSGIAYQVKNDSAIRMHVEIYKLTDSSVLVSKGLDTNLPVISKGVEYIKKGSRIEIKN